MAADKQPSVTGLSFGSWEHPKIEGTPPAPRYGHASVVLGNRMYMWGGASSKEDGGTLWYNDMHILQFGDAMTWEVATQEGEIPTPREGHTLNVIEDDLYLYGGVDKEDTFTCAEGLYVFKTGSRTWFKRETTGTPPQAQNCSVVVSDQRLVSFGGILNGVAQNTVHILDTALLDWALAQTTGTPPPPRCDHACAVVGHKMYLTGGSGSDDLFYNDVHVLNLGSLEWNCAEMKGIPPKPRDYTTLTALSSWYLILFAGSSQVDGSEVAFADLHYVDLTSKQPTWTSVSFKDGAPPVARYGHTTVLYQKKLCVFGGQNTEQELNDVCTVKAIVPTTDFDPTPVPRTRYNTSTPVPAPRKPLLPAPPKPVKPRDFEELRTTYVKRINEMFDTLSEKFLQLDTATETLSGERAAFEAEKKAHYELYERQQKELKEMLDSHRQQNEEWIEKMRVENDQERRALAEERAHLEKASAELAQDQEVFQQKSKKLDAIMRQVQGLNA